MEVGNMVARIGDRTQTWKIVNAKSDFRGFWIQLDRDEGMPDVWHDASYFEVVNESR